MNSALVSSFELLFKEIAPPSSAINRKAIQAYFLMISNLTDAAAGDVTFALKFTAGGAPLSSSKLVTAFDAGLGNNFGSLTDGMTEDYTIPAGYSGLFLLQPRDLSPMGPEVEIRGTVEIILLPFSEANTAKLMLTPQQRGTFLSADPAIADLDQQSYGLPTPDGKYIFELNK
jgi:hypothetical protein